MVVGRQEVLGEHPLGAPGVDEPAERHEHHGGARGGRVGVGLELVELGWVLHGEPSSGPGGAGAAAVIMVSRVARRPRRTRREPAWRPRLLNARSAPAASTHGVDRPLDPLERDGVCRAEASARTARPAAPPASSRSPRRRSAARWAGRRHASRSRVGRSAASTSSTARRVPREVGGRPLQPVQHAARGSGRGRAAAPRRRRPRNRAGRARASWARTSATRSARARRVIASSRLLRLEVLGQHRLDEPDHLHHPGRRRGCAPPRGRSSKSARGAHRAVHVLGAMASTAHGEAVVEQGRHRPVRVVAEGELLGVAEPGQHLLPGRARCRASAAAAPRRGARPRASVRVGQHPQRHRARPRRRAPGSPPPAVRLLEVGRELGGHVADVPRRRPGPLERRPRRGATCRRSCGAATARTASRSRPRGEHAAPGVLDREGHAQVARHPLDVPVAGADDDAPVSCGRPGQDRRSAARRPGRSPRCGAARGSGGRVLRRRHEEPAGHLGQRADQRRDEAPRAAPAPASRTPSPSTWLSTSSGTCTVTPSSARARLEPVGQGQLELALRATSRGRRRCRPRRRRSDSSSSSVNVEQVRGLALTPSSTTCRSAGPTRPRRGSAGRRRRRPSRRRRAGRGDGSVPPARRAARRAGRCRRRTGAGSSSRPPRGRAG